MGQHPIEKEHAKKAYKALRESTTWDHALAFMLKGGRWTVADFETHQATGTDFLDGPTLTDVHFKAETWTCRAGKKWTDIVVYRPFTSQHRLVMDRWSQPAAPQAAASIPST